MCQYLYSFLIKCLIKYMCTAFIVYLRHKFTNRNMNEIPVFVQSSELCNRKWPATKSTMKEFHLYVEMKI